MNSPTLSAGLVALLLVTAALLWTKRSELLSVDAAGEGARGGADQERAATADDVCDALTLLALALGSGAGMTQCLDHVASRCQTPAGHHLAVVSTGLKWGLSPAAAWAVLPEVWRPAAMAWQVSAQLGAGPAKALVAAAQVIRDAEDQRVEQAVQRAATLLVLPLGLAFLPGFVLTALVPLITRLVSSAVS